jgi:hypothetical protein
MHDRGKLVCTYARTKNPSRAKTKKAMWASPTVKPVEATLGLVYFIVCCSVIFLSRPVGHFVRDITRL